MNEHTVRTARHRPPRWLRSAPQSHSGPVVDMLYMYVTPRPSRILGRSYRVIRAQSQSGPVVDIHDSASQSHTGPVRTVRPAWASARMCALSTSLGGRVWARSVRYARRGPLPERVHYPPRSVVVSVHVC